MRLLLSCLFAAGSMFAQPLVDDFPASRAGSRKEGNPEQRVRVVADLISIPRKEAYGLVRLPSKQMWESLVAMIREGTASSEYVIASVAADGQDSTFESSEERRLSTSFIPPETDDGFIPPLTASDVVSMSVVPGAFESHGIGTEWEAHAIIQGSSVEIYFMLRLREFDRLLEFPLRKPGLFPSIGTPSFWSIGIGRQRFTGNLGDPLFITASDFSRAELTGPRNRVLLMFLTAIRD